MTEYDVKRYAAIEAINARIEAMKVDNDIQASENWVIKYGKESFDLCADNLLQLATLSDDSLIEFLKHTSL